MSPCTVAGAVTDVKYHLYEPHACDHTTLDRPMGCEDYHLRGYQCGNSVTFLTSVTEVKLGRPAQSVAVTGIREE